MSTSSQDSKREFLRGITDGVPICLGYFSVAFAFGIFAVGNGLTVLQSLLISMTNVTSAGQLAAVPIMTSGGTLIELAVAQLVINLRYALMSVSLSQKLGKNVRMLDRFIVSFVNTDEVFAVASGNPGSVCREYLYGLILTPYIGWSAGTLVGAVAGNILPQLVITSLGVAIYGMFTAIVVPAMKRDRGVTVSVIAAAAISTAIHFVPALKFISYGFAVIISSVAAAAVSAYLSARGERN